MRTKRKRRSLTRSMALIRRRCAILLVLVFVWDLGFDLLAPLHGDRETPLTAGNIAEAPNPEPHPDCGLPDHECALSHHHHFPALVSTAQFLILSVASRLQTGTLLTAASHPAVRDGQIRAPPAEV